MDYGIKTLPITGGLGSLALIYQGFVLFGILLLVLVIALGIRFLWRRNKSIGE